LDTAVVAGAVAVEVILAGAEVVTAAVTAAGAEVDSTTKMDSFRPIFETVIKMSYNRVEPHNLVVGKSYFIVPTARLITENKKDYKFIREHLKKRILFPEGKLETMRDVPEGSSYGEVFAKQWGREFQPTTYYWYFPACSFTGLNSNGKPLLKSVKNFIRGGTKVDGYTFFSTELTPDAVNLPVPAPVPAPAPSPVTTATVDLKMTCPSCGNCLEVENGLLKLKIKSD
jgi:hypothetical protein